MANSSTSAASAASETSSTTTTPAANANATGSTTQAFVSRSPVHPRGPLERDYEIPAGEVDVEQALSAKPGPWSFQGQMEANRKREQRAIAARLEPDNETRKKDLEKSKQDLLNLHNSIRWI